MHGCGCEAKPVWQSICSTLEQDKAWRRPTGSGQHFCQAAEHDWLSDKKADTQPHSLSFTHTQCINTNKRHTPAVRCSHTCPLWSCGLDNGQLFKEAAAGEKKNALMSTSVVHSRRCVWGQKDTRWWCWSSRWHQGSGSESGGSAHREWWPSPRTQWVRWLKQPPLEPQPGRLRKVTMSGEGTGR